MLRKCVIIVLTLAAAGTGILALSTFFPPRFLSTGAGSRAQVICLRTSWVCLIALSENKYFRFAVKRRHLSFSYIDIHDASGRPPDWSVSLLGFGVARTTTHPIKIPAGHGEYPREVNPIWNRKTPELVYSLHLPLWALFGILLIYPTVALTCGPLRAWRRRNRGLCVKCGYDLTGNTSGICPECGTTI